MKLESPSVARNTGPILQVLREWLPPSGLVLEVASGTGEHALAFAGAFPELRWQPSDPDPESQRSIAAWQAEGPANLLPPIALDVSAATWPVERADAVLSINMVHISPWAASLGLLNGARRVLREGGPLILYGPWLVEGEQAAPSNLAFDADLRRRNPAWGLREVGAFAEEASQRGLALAAQRAMPTNNRMLLFTRGG